MGLSPLACLHDGNWARGSEQCTLGVKGTAEEMKSRAEQSRAEQRATEAYLAEMRRYVGMGMGMGMGMGGRMDA